MSGLSSFCGDHGIVDTARQVGLSSLLRIVVYRYGRMTKSDVPLYRIRCRDVRQIGIYEISIRTMRISCRLRSPRREGLVMEQEEMTVEFLPCSKCRMHESTMLRVVEGYREPNSAIVPQRTAPVRLRRYGR